MVSKIKPPAILMLICSIVCGLLIFAYEATYVDTTGIITDNLKEGLNEIYGDSTSEFIMLKNDDGSVLNYEGVTSIIKNAENQLAFEIIADGYAKDGIHALIGIDSNGSVTGISIISLGETQGLGTKISEKFYLDKYKGVTSADNIDTITGATYSSKGLKDAVNTAINTYNEHKEEIIVE